MTTPTLTTQARPEPLLGPDGVMRCDWAHMNDEARRAVGFVGAGAGGGGYDEEDAEELSAHQVTLTLGEKSTHAPPPPPPGAATPRATTPRAPGSSLLSRLFGGGGAPSAAYAGLGPEPWSSRSAPSLSLTRSGAV